MRTFRTCGGRPPSSFGSCRFGCLISLGSFGACGRGSLAAQQPLCARLIFCKLSSLAGPILGRLCNVFGHLSGLRHLSSHPGGRAREGVGQASQIPLCRVFVSSQLAGRLRNTVGSGIKGAAESAKSNVPHQSAAANNRLVERMEYVNWVIGIGEDVVVPQEFFGFMAKPRPAAARFLPRRLWS